MKKPLLLLLAGILIPLLSFAQTPADSILKDTTYWNVGGIAGATFSNTGFGNASYWQGGGINASTFGGLFEVYADYERGKNEWDNNVSLAYGSTKQGELPWLKSDDRILLVSKYGHRISEKILFTTLMDFRSQFAPGYDFGDNGEQIAQISDFLSPAYINLGVGFDYKPSKILSVYYAPLNLKSTIVLIDSLRPSYMPAEFTDNALRMELGSFLKIVFVKKLMENITFSTKADFFTNYLDNFGNIDVNWETLTAFKINEWFTATFFTHLIYDDDITFDKVDDNGNKIMVPDGMGGMVTVPAKRTQFKHVLSLGLTYRFGNKRAE